MKRKIVPAFLMAACAVFAQEEAGSIVSGPLVAVLHDARAARIRPILGIPGASTQGSALDSDSIAAAANGDGYAVLLVGESRQPRVLDIKSGGTRGIPGALEWADTVVLSPDGRAAVLYSSELEKMCIVTGLPSEPSVAADFPVPAGLLHIAVDNDGEYVLAAQPSDGSRLVSINRAGEVLTVAALPGITAVALRPGASGVAVSDGASVLLLDSVQPGAEVREIAGERDGLSQPSALGWSSDGKALFAADAKGVVSLRDEGPPVRLDAVIVPDRMQRIAPGIFQLNEAGHGAVWLLETDTAEPKVTFVPPHTTDGGDLK